MLRHVTSFLATCCPVMLILTLSVLLRFGLALEMIR